MPPPCCIVSAPSCSAPKMPSSESAIVAHDEAVEERDAAGGARAGEDAAARQEAEIRERAGKAAFPSRPVFMFGGSEGLCDARPGRLDGRLGAALGGVEAIASRPDFLGKPVRKCRHGSALRRSAAARSGRSGQCPPGRPKGTVLPLGGQRTQ